VIALLGIFFIDDSRMSRMMGALVSSTYAADAQRGATAFQQCATCHSTKDGEHLTGPSLAHVWGRKAGTQKDFLRYSDALEKSAFTWNEKTLDQWLQNPTGDVHGSKMFITVPNAEDRQNVIAYLETLK